MNFEFPEVFLLYRERENVTAVFRYRVVQYRYELTHYSTLEITVWQRNSIILIPAVDLSSTTRAGLK